MLAKSGFVTLKVLKLVTKFLFLTVGATAVPLSQQAKVNNPRPSMYPTSVLHTLLLLFFISVVKCS